MRSHPELLVLCSCCTARNSLIFPYRSAGQRFARSSRYFCLATQSPQLLSSRDSSRLQRTVPDVISSVASSLAARVVVDLDTLSDCVMKWAERSFYRPGVLPRLEQWLNVNVSPFNEIFPGLISRTICFLGLHLRSARLTGA